MYKLNKIINYEVTRDLILESEESKQEYKVFDDSDILGNNKFDFLEVGKKYQCKINIFGDISDSNNGTKFLVLGKEKVGNRYFEKIANEMGDVFFVPICDFSKTDSIIYVNIRRYDLLAVNNIIYDKSFKKVQE